MHGGRRIGQPQSRDAGEKRAIDPVARVGQRDPAREPSGNRVANLSERDLGFGLELHLRWEMGLLAARCVLRPILRLAMLKRSVKAVVGASVDAPV